MARRKTAAASQVPDRGDVPEFIDTPVTQEMSNSFLSYAMSVIVSRALPDVRDGLKPVHRRILYSMYSSGLRPDRSYVKSARVVGDVMGRFHPHGDSAIYEAMVRMTQDFSMRVPTIDGHGNFGTHADGAAAMRYTEARMAAAAVALTDELDEDTVDMVDNYDGKLKEPSVLPCRYPNLLVNGSTGIAVGMATNMAPHNMGEVIAACQHLLTHPDATTDDLIAFIPAPDFPTGGVLVGTDGAHEAYRTGRGQIHVRARTEFVDATARKRGIMVTELPYQVGPERVMARIKEVKDSGKLDAVTGVVDLSDRKHGMRLLIELRSGANETRVLRELFRLTPLQESFNIHNLALVNGSPRTLTLRELVGHFVSHRLEVTRRRCEFRLAKATERAHLLQGYLLALASIDEVVAVLRSSSDTTQARVRLCEAFAMTPAQATAVLEMPLRRLTSLEVEKITSELADLTSLMDELAGLLGSHERMRALVGQELQATGNDLGAARATTILTLDGAQEPEQDDPDPGAGMADDPTIVWLNAAGFIGRAPQLTGRATKADAMRSWVASSTRSTVGLITTSGRLLLLGVHELPDAQASKTRGLPVADLVELDPGESVVSVVRTDQMLLLVTRAGLVKRVSASDVPKRSGSVVIIVKDADAVVAALNLADGHQDDPDVVIVTSGGQLLRTPVRDINPKGSKARGMSGIRVPQEQEVLTAAVVFEDPAVLVTCTDTGAVKVTPLAEYPVKGRGGQGVRCHKFLRGQARLVAAGVGLAGELTAVTSAGALLALPKEQGRRDGSGTPVEGASGIWGLPPAQRQT